MKDLPKDSIIERWKFIEPPTLTIQESKILLLGRQSHLKKFLKKQKVF